MAMGMAVPAFAEVVTKSDPQPKCSQRDALDVKRASFNYAEQKFAWRIKMASASKKRTRVIGRYTQAARSDTPYDVMVVTSYDSDGIKRVVGRWYDADDGSSGRFTDGVTADWDFANEVITIELTSHLKGERADAWAYSVAKGAVHGPPCGDYIWSGRISRG